MSEQPREGENARVDGDRWVNAVVEFVFPLDDVPVTATPEEKSAAAYAAVDETASILIDRHGAVVTTTYEDAPSDEPAQPQPRGERDDLAARLEARADNADEMAAEVARNQSNYGESGPRHHARLLAAAYAFRKAAEMARASTHPEQSGRVEELREAFDAGFEASGEGYNGEYLGPKVDYPSCNDRYFAEFLSTRDAPADIEEIDARECAYDPAQTEQGEGEAL